MPTYEIIIAHYGTGRLTELCRKCLESIARYSQDYRVVLVDNASPELEKILPLLRGMPHRLIRNSRNLGFVQATNQGLMVSTASYLVMMNNDTEAVPGWLEKLREPLTGNVGISGPLTTTRGSWQGRWPQDKKGVFLIPTNAMLAFFCTMFRRDVIEKVGYLDESYGIGFGDDDAYCWMAHQKGFRLALVQDLIIPHWHRSTFKSMFSEDQIHKMQEANLQKFRSQCLHSSRR